MPGRQSGTDYGSLRRSWQQAYKRKYLASYFYSNKFLSNNVDCAPIGLTPAGSLPKALIRLAEAGVRAYDFGIVFQQGHLG